jgi:Tol biopolymer transport system component
MLAPEGVGPVWSPDGATIAFVRSDPDDGGVMVMPSDGGEARVILPIGPEFGVGSLAWSPDGDQLAYILRAYGEAPEQQLSLWIVNADGSDAHESATLDPDAFLLDWGPEGSSVLVSTYAMPGGSVSIVDPRTGESQAVTSRAGWARWAPGGTTVVALMRTSSDPDPESQWDWRLADARVVDGRLEHIAFIGDVERGFGYPQNSIAVSPKCPSGS